jgi:hypothetical protein
MRFALPPECMRSYPRSSPQDDAILDILPEHQRFTWGYPCVRVEVAFLIGPRLTPGGFGHDALAVSPGSSPTGRTADTLPDRDASGANRDTLRTGRVANIGPAEPVV